MMETVIHNEKFLNQGIDFSFLESREDLDQIFEKRKGASFGATKPVHQLPYVKKTVKTLSDMYEDLLGQGNNLALNEDCAAAISDVHGDSAVLLSSFILTGAVKFDPTKVVLVDIDTGKIYDNQDEMLEVINQSKAGNLKHTNTFLEQEENNRLVYLPLIEKNPNFKGEINVLGDYLDRGNEGPQNLAIIYYAKKLGINVNFILGNHEVYGANGDGQEICFNRHIIKDMLQKDILKPLYIDEATKTVWEHVSLPKNFLTFMLNDFRSLLPGNNIKFNDETCNKLFEEAKEIFLERLNLTENENLKGKLSEKLLKNLNSAEFIFEELYEKNYSKLLESIEKLPNFGNEFDDSIKDKISDLINGYADEKTINETFASDEDLREIFFKNLNENEILKGQILDYCDFEKLYEILIKKYGFDDMDFFKLKNILIYSLAVSNFFQYVDENNLKSLEPYDQKIITKIFPPKEYFLCYRHSKGEDVQYFEGINQNYGHTPSEEQNVEIDDKNKLTKLDIGANYTENVNKDSDGKPSSLVGFTLFNKKTNNIERVAYRAFRDNINKDNFYELTGDFELQVTNENCAIVHVENKEIKNTEPTFNRESFLKNYSKYVENAKDLLSEPKDDEEFSNQGVSYDFLNSNAKYDELMEYGKYIGRTSEKTFFKIHQLSHMHNMAQTSLDIKENFCGKNNICLKKGYIIAVSDIHGDFMVFLGNLILSGVCTVDPENFVLIDIDTGEIYDTEEKIVDAIQKLNDNKLIHENYNETEEKDRLIYLPKITLNQNFEATINFLGDYIDRGSEDLQCLALILYLTKLNENLNLKINFLLGNHEVIGTCGAYHGAERYQHIISKMIENNILKICMFEEIENGQLLVFEHTLFTKRNLSAMVTLLIVLLDKNFELNENDINELRNKEMYTDETSFINEFKENVAKCRELFEIELKKDSALENKINNLVNNFFIATPESFDILFAKLSTKDKYLDSIKKVLNFNRYIGFKDELYKLLEIDNLDFSDSNEDKWNQLCDKLISEYWTKFQKKLSSNYNNLLDIFNKSIENWDLSWENLNFERLMSDECKKLFKQKLESNDYEYLRENIYCALEMIEQKQDMDTLFEILEAKTNELKELRNIFFQKCGLSIGLINEFNDLLKKLNNELNLKALHETLGSEEKRKTFLEKIKSEENFQNHFVKLLNELNEQNQFEILCTTLKSDETRREFCEKLYSLNKNFSKELKELFRDLYLHDGNWEILYETLISEACGFSVKNFFEIKDKVTKNTLVLYKGTLGGFYEEENFLQKALYAECGKLNPKSQLGWPLGERPSYNPEDLFEEISQIHGHTRDEYNKININKPKDINEKNINLDLMASVGYNHDKSIIAPFFFASNGKYGVIKYIVFRKKDLDENMYNILQTNDDGKKFILEESENTIRYYENGNIIQYKNDLEEKQNELSFEQIKSETFSFTSEKNENENDIPKENNDGINAIDVPDKVKKPKENSKEDVKRPAENNKKDKDKTDESSNENNDNDNNNSDSDDNNNDNKPDAPKIKLQNPPPEIISTLTNSDIKNNNDNNDNHNSDSDSGSFGDSDDDDKHKKIGIELQNPNNVAKINGDETEYASGEDGGPEIDGDYPDSNDNNKVDLNSILPENFKTGFKIDNAENYYSEIKMLIKENIPETEDKHNLLATINNLDNNPNMTLGRKIKELIRLLLIVIELTNEYLAKNEEDKKHFETLPIKDQLTTLRVYKNLLFDKFTNENLDKIEPFTDKDVELFEMELKTILKDKIHPSENVLSKFDKLDEIPTIERLKLKIKMIRELSKKAYINFLIGEGFNRRQRSHYADEFSQLSWLEQINICETVMKKQESDKILRDENMSLFERWVDTKNSTEKEKNNATKSFKKLSVKDQMLCLQKLNVFDIPPIEQNDVPQEI